MTGPVGYEGQEELGGGQRVRERVVGRVARQAVLGSYGVEPKFALLGLTVRTVMAAAG